jgi:hypothetical protein
MQLRASQLPQEHWVSKLLGALGGAAKKSFTRIHGEAPTNTWSGEDFQLAVASLVPDHAVQFSMAATNMRFSAKTLCDDIARFALLIKNGDLMVNPNSRFVFTYLQNKLIEAQANILSVAKSHFNLYFVYCEDFEKHVHAAQCIAEKLHTGGLLSSWIDKTTQGSSDRQSLVTS